MGCCGCSPYLSAKVAGCFGIIQSILWLIGDIYLVKIFTSDPGFKIYNGYEEVPMSFYIRVICINIPDEMKILSIISVVLSALSLSSSLGLLYHNSQKKSKYVRQWAFISYVTTIFTIGYTIFYSLRTQNFFSLLREIPSSGPVMGQLIMAYFVLSLIVDKGALILWIINICFANSVRERANQIESLNDVNNTSTLAQIVYSPGMGPGNGMAPMNPNQGFVPQQLYQPNNTYYMPVQLMTRYQTAGAPLTNNLPPSQPDMYPEKPPSYNQSAYGNHNGYFSEGEGQSGPIGQGNRGYASDGERFTQYQ